MVDSLWFSAPLSFAAALTLILFSFTPAASADATLAPPPLYSSAPGLPDSRVYELVSPANKSGHYAGANNLGEANYSVATADGNAVEFGGAGAMGRSPSATASLFVARRSTGGWSTTAAAPAPFGAPPLLSPPIMFVPSANLSASVFVAPVPYVQPPIGQDNIYLAGEDPFALPTWIGRPTTADPSPELSNMASGAERMAIDGVSPDLGRIYFSYGGTLTPIDSSRSPFAWPFGRQLLGYADGFYEWTPAGGLVAAGVLPGGAVSPFGAAAAAEPDVGQAIKPAEFGNQVSADGSRAFFVSPDPLGPLSSCTVAAPGGCTPQIYVREIAPDGSHSSVLVSRDVLLEESPGSPAASPSGPVAMANNHQEAPDRPKPYLYASPDGSHAFFQSADRLTVAAPVDASPKTYEFDLKTETLTYLPGFSSPAGTSPILASSRDGSSVLFTKDTGEVPTELDLWQRGSAGGTVTTISQLPAPPAPSPASPNPNVANVTLPSARVSVDGSIVVFQTNSPLGGGFNNAAGYQEVYRYDVAAVTVGCVSCPPHGVTPSGDAHLSSSDIHSGPQNFLTANRGISADGSRIFFDTPDPLVAQDTNTNPATPREGEDVYEWENGTIYLISSGIGRHASSVLDNSESGNDLFFTTTDSLVSTDTDGAFDVYDARIPRSGDNPPAEAVPCQGDVCQGAPNVPALLSVPPTGATSSGTGNLAPILVATTNAHTPKVSTSAHRLSTALKACKRLPARRRSKCKAQAKKRYGAPGKSKSSKGRQVT